MRAPRWALTFVPVIGPAGVGKSRLISAFVNELEEGDMPWHIDAGDCGRPGASAPYEPFTQMVQHRYGLHEITDPAYVMQRLAEVYTGSESSMTRDGAAVRAKALGRLLGLVTADQGDAVVRSSSDDEKNKRNRRGRPHEQGPHPTQSPHFDYWAGPL